MILKIEQVRSSIFAFIQEHQLYIVANLSKQSVQVLMYLGYCLSLDKAEKMKHLSNFMFIEEINKHQVLSRIIEIDHEFKSLMNECHYDISYWLKEETILCVKKIIANFMLVDANTDEVIE